MYWRYSLADYPILVQWKLLGEGQYVVGVEPSNCHVEGRRANAKWGHCKFFNPCSHAIIALKLVSVILFSI